ncbi:MAG: SH3 domain-containing protein [Desulfobulbaceae bacterium]|jgi:SH3-like domain-containing protein|nr:SH3 domain-containing protein [Desulfobulbaceae bacterium]
MNTCRHTVVLALLALLAATLIAPQANGATMLAVARDGVFLRDAPDSNGKTLWKYEKGFPLEITGKRGDWRKVKDFEGDGGWLLAADLNKEPHMVVRANKHSGGKLKVNIRKGPGEKFDVVGEAVYGSVFMTLEQKHNWVRVRHVEPGVEVEGWIKHNMLWGF